MHFIIKTILHWLILSCAVLLTAKIVAGISVNPLTVSFIVGAVLTLFNMFIKPIINILTLPLNILTLGIFSLVVNGILFWYMGVYIVGFTVANFSAAFIGALLVSIINWIFKKLLRL